MGARLGGDTGGLPGWMESTDGGRLKDTHGGDTTQMEGQHDPDGPQTGPRREDFHDCVLKIAQVSSPSAPEVTSKVCLIGLHQTLPAGR